MEETSIEIILGMLARIGIVTAHGLELSIGIHTVTAVIILWSLEEIVSVGHSAKHLKHRHSGCFGRAYIKLFKK